MHKACNGNLGGHVHGWPNYQCSCHYMRIVGRDLCVVTRVPLSADSKSVCHLFFRDYVLQGPMRHDRSVGLFVNPLGPAARLDNPRDKEPVTENKNIQYMIQIPQSMVAEFNERHKRRADTAMLLGRAVPGGGRGNERGTMYPYHDLPEISLSRNRAD